METISIRNLRGERLREEARKGKLLAITNRGGLIGVVVPVAAAWLEHLIDYNLSQVQQSIDEAEQYLAAGQPAVTIGEVVGQLHGMLNPGQAESESARPTTKTLRIGDLSAKEIEQAGADGQTIAVTHERELIAINGSTGATSSGPCWLGSSRRCWRPLSIRTRRANVA